MTGKNPSNTPLYIITGAAGFIGSALTRALKSRPNRGILGVDRLDGSEKWKNLMRSGIHDYMDKDEFIEYIQQRPSAFSNSFEKNPVRILHMGACSSTTEKDGHYMLENNFTYSKKIITWAMEQGYRIAYASSAATYGNGEAGYSDQTDLDVFKPLNVYGYSKHLQDVWALQKGYLAKCAALKFFNVYGPGEEYKEDMSSVSFKSFLQINEHKKVKLFKSYKEDVPDGEQKRDFVYIKDVVAMVLHVLENPQANGVFNIGSGKAESFLALVKAMFQALNVPETIEFIDMPPGLAEKYQYFTQADMRKLYETGYSSGQHSLAEAAADYVTYLKNPDRYSF